MHRDQFKTNLSEAWYDSNSGIAFMPFSHLFDKIESNSSNAGLQSGHLALIHQTTFWLQHIGSGFGAMINSIRECRDNLIINIFQGSSILNAEAVKKIKGKKIGAIQPLLNLEDTNSKVATGEPYPLACAMYWVEQLLTNPKYSTLRHRYASLIVFCLSYIQYGHQLVKNDNGTIMNFKTKSRFEDFKADSSKIFSTWQLQQAQAWINELFIYVISQDFETYKKRHLKLINSESYDPIDYAMGTFLNVKETKNQLNNGDMNLLASILLTIQIAIDVALDVSIYPFGTINELTDQDIYPPSRFNRALNAIIQIGFIKAEGEFSYNSIAQYRSQVIMESKLACASFWCRDHPHPYVSYKNFYRSFLENNVKQKNPSKNSIPFNFYSIIKFLQTEAMSLRSRFGLFYPTDMMASLIETSKVKDLAYYSADFYRYVDSSHKYLYLPPVFVYENSRVGYTDNNSEFANIFMKCSINSFAIFDMFFENKKLNFSPIYFKDDFNLRPFQNFKRYFFEKCQTTESYYGY